MKIIFLGPQGSGKSTQARHLAQVMNLPYIEMGQMLREKSQGSDTEAGEIRQALEVGDLVPDLITIRILQERLAKSDTQNGFILDGYPRNYAQLEGLPPGGIDKVFYFKVPDEQAIQRLIERGRADDTLEVISRRLELFHKETEPLLTYFRQQGIIEELDGSQSIEVLQADLVRRIKNENSKNQ